MLPNKLLTNEQEPIQKSPEEDEKGGIIVSYAEEIADTARNVLVMAETIGKIAVDLTRNRVNAALQNVFPQPAGSEPNSSDIGVEIIDGRKIVVWLVHPTNYRKDGTPRKWERQILPTNAIGQLWALMPKVITNSRQEDIPVELHFLEDTVQPFDINAIEQSMQGEDVKGVVMLCGVQTNQWPRAHDLASLCKRRSIPIVAGGYHVRADLPLTDKQAKEMGISLAIGEAESSVLHDGRPFLGAILEDVWNDDLKSTYLQGENPSIEMEEISVVIPGYQELMINPSMATLETSRGCPFLCSFCTIRSIGGSKVRTRSPGQMRDWFRGIYEQQGIDSIFLTDDNFATNKHGDEILKVFTELRKEGLQFKLMIQADTTATTGRHRKRFVEACKNAGVQSVFLGVESLDSATLKGMNKRQNRPDRYKPMISAWHDANIMVQCGFILGNPQETKGVGKRTAQALGEIGMDLAAPFIRAPLPGSNDYYEYHRQGVICETDFNLYDCHSAACLEFPDGLTREAVLQEYWAFNDEFFALKNFPRLAKRLHDDTLRLAVRQWFWYKYSLTQGDHPMFSGVGKLPPDFMRSYFQNGNAPSIDNLAPRPYGPGDPSKEKRSLPVLPGLKID